jgi:hypothetical protein
VFGTWSTTFPNASSNNSGTVSGLFTNPLFTVGFQPALLPSVPVTCPYPFADANLTVSGNSLVGTYRACSAAESGTLALTKH